MDPKAQVLFWANYGSCPLCAVYFISQPLAFFACPVGLHVHFCFHILLFVAIVPNKNDPAASYPAHRAFYVEGSGYFRAYCWHRVDRSFFLAWCFSRGPVLHGLFAS